MMRKWRVTSPLHVEPDVRELSVEVRDRPWDIRMLWSIVISLMF